MKIESEWKKLNRWNIAHKKDAKNKMQKSYDRFSWRRKKFKQFLHCSYVSTNDLHLFGNVLFIFQVFHCLFLFF